VKECWREDGIHVVILMITNKLLQLLIITVITIISYDADVNYK